MRLNSSIFFSAFISFRMQTLIERHRKNKTLWLHIMLFNGPFVPHLINRTMMFPYEIAYRWFSAIKKPFIIAFYSISFKRAKKQTNSKTVRRKWPEIKFWFFRWQQMKNAVKHTLDVNRLHSCCLVSESPSNESSRCALPRKRSLCRIVDRIRFCK